MIFCALKTIILEDSSETITVHKGDFFRSPSSDVVTQGYARRLTKEEARTILNDYVAYADKVFNKPQRVSSQKPQKKIGIKGRQGRLPL
jgi:hypothetical protein